jgi:hypothetical protein
VLNPARIGPVLAENGSYAGSKTSGRFLKRTLPGVIGAQPGPHDSTFRAKAVSSVL